MRVSGGKRATTAADKPARPNRTAVIKVRMRAEDRAKLEAVAARVRLDIGPFLLMAGFEEARRRGLLDDET